MITTFHINESELDVNFIKALKAMFKNRDLTLTIETNSIDETEHLMSSPNNKNRLLNAIKNVNERNNLQNIDLDELKKIANA